MYASDVDRSRAIRISKLLSLGLRHEPAALGITLDAAGWADVSAILLGLAARNEHVTYDDLERIVSESDKRRFALSADGERIRANQGHSVDVDLGLPRMAPPEILFHGTVDRFLDSIRREGLVRGARTHVHLSADEATAKIVARRRAGAGTHLILRVRARALNESGHAFFLSENGVWLTERVPPPYLELP